MFIQYQPQNTWDSLNSKIKYILFNDPQASADVKVFRGLNHALSEVTRSLVQTYPHKNKAVYFSSLSPFFEAPMKQLSMGGYEVQNFKLDQMDNPQFIDSLGREFLFALSSEDDPWFALKYKTQEFEKKIIDKKIFSLNVSHHGMYFTSTLPQPEKYQIKLYPLSPLYCIAVFGSKVKISAEIASGLYWSEQDEFNINELLQVKSTENQNKVLNFETSHFLNANYLFKDHSRYFDRVIMSLNNMDGYSFIYYLSQTMGRNLLSPGQDPLMETLSLSRWKSNRLFEWFLNKGLSPEEIRGLIILSSSLLTDANLVHLNSTYSQVLTLQG